MLNIQTTKEDGTLVMTLEGRIDTNTASELDAAIKMKTADAEKLVLDFEKVDYVSSAGLRVLLSADKIMRRAGGMKILNANEIVREVFEVTGFANVLTIE